MMEDFQIKMMSASWRICRWFFWQILLFYCMPYLWLNHYDTATVVLMLLYTTSFSVHWEFASEANRFRLLWIPYLAYCAIAVTLCCSIGTWNASILFSILIPLYGAACVLLTRGSERLFQSFRKGNKFGRIVTVAALVIFLVSLKTIGISWESSRQGTPEMERNEMLVRRNYLLGKLLVTPGEVLNEMPSAIGVQFQGEWALYSCSMLSAALVDMSKLYPETRQENLQYVDSLISIVMSPELSYYDYLRWGEDPLESLDGVVIPDNHIVTGLEDCRKTLCFYNKIREILYEFVAEEELEQSGEQDSIIVPVGHNVVLDDNNLLEGIINAFERIQFLLTFFFGFYLVGRLNIVLLVPISSNEIYLILDVLGLPIPHFP